MVEFISTLPGAIATITLIILVISPNLKKTISKDNVKIWMQVILSIIVVAASLYVILSSNYDDGVEKWAFGAIGTVLGFWLPT